MDLFRLSVVTGDGTVFDDQVEYVNIPTGFGSVGVLAGHAPMLCAVAKGIVRAKRGEELAVRIAVGEGVANVAENEATLLISDGKLLEE